MSNKAAEHHKKASEHLSHAARHHGEAAKHHEGGQHEKAALCLKVFYFLTEGPLMPLVVHPIDVLAIVSSSASRA